MAGDRGYRGKKNVNGTKIMIPYVHKKSDCRYQKHKLFCKRAGIEPTTGHLKSDYRLGRNFYKDVVGDNVNMLLAAAAYNFKRAMKALWCMIQKFHVALPPCSDQLRQEAVSQNNTLRVNFHTGLSGQNKRQAYSLSGKILKNKAILSFYLGENKRFFVAIRHLEILMTSKFAARNDVVA